MARIMNMDRCPYPVPVSVVCDADVERGLILEIVGAANNDIWLDNAEDNEAYKVQLAGANAERGNLLMHTSVPFSYDERDTERDFVLKAGQVGRGHYLNVGDEYTIAADLVAGDAVVGAEVGLAANGELAVGSSVVIGVVTKVYTWNGQASIRIRIK